MSGNTVVIPKGDQPGGRSVEIGFDGMVFLRKLSAAQLDAVLWPTQPKAPSVTPAKEAE